ncbi:hypothetical protein [Streptomyces sp. S186]|uniref:hypothetical protein n=1 Tax=Streptomyces sp. S186 TaxID=3434395 RepID=UPI003F669645
MTAKSAAAATRATVYGYPRQGPRRELRNAIEGYWQDRVGAAELHRTAPVPRSTNCQQPAEAGAGEGPTGDRLWINPDCGLKSRSWAEVRPAMERMTAAARHVPHQLSTKN